MTATLASLFQSYFPLPAIIQTDKLQSGWGNGPKVCKQMNQSQNHIALDSLNFFAFEQSAGIVTSVNSVTYLVDNLIFSQTT